MSALRQDQLPYRILLAMLRVIARAFFRRIEVVGTGNVPRDRGGVLVAWHPNGLVDPCLVLTCFPCHVVFGARHGLFRWPIVGTILRALGTVPIYRATDLPKSQERARVEGNRQSLSALAKAVAEGSYAALFPEGKSHDQPTLAPIKAGAARLYYEARAECAPDAPVPAIVPVGIYYDEKRLFRTRALVWFHPPIELRDELDVTEAPDEPSGANKSRIRALTQTIADVLETVVHPADDWATHDTLQRVRKLVRAERKKRAGAESAKPSLEEKTLGFARARDAYYKRRVSHPQQAAALRQRVEAYDASLQALRLDDHELDSSPKLMNPMLIAFSVLQFLLVFIALPPLLLLGFVLNAPTALLVRWGARLFAKQPKDLATVKILIGCAAFPLTWIGVGVGGALAHEAVSERFSSLPDSPVWLGLALAILTAIGGIHALTYQKLTSETIRNFRVRIALITKAKPIADALSERAAIFDEIMQIATGLELPGQVTPDGAVSRKDAAGDHDDSATGSPG
jgi:glycerol-3-phosphate O-acyltransferase/dihydroxyacetone phosphate acyltransferase